jgi:hypothetical protein
MTVDACGLAMVFLTDDRIGIVPWRGRGSRRTYHLQDIQRMRVSPMNALRPKPAKHASMPSLPSACVRLPVVSLWSP